jgi:Spy/CpxP family protein refolding chaperone
MKKMFATVAAGLALSGMAGVGLMAGEAAAATPAAASRPTTGRAHPLRAWLREHRKAVARDTVQISAKAIGISSKALVSALRSGQSITEVAQAHGVDVQTVVNALVQAGDARIGQAVDSHKLTSAQATKLEAALPKAVTRVVGHVDGRHAA